MALMRRAVLRAVGAHATAAGSVGPRAAAGGAGAQRWASDVPPDVRPPLPLAPRPPGEPGALVVVEVALPPANAGPWKRAAAPGGGRCAGWEPPSLAKAKGPLGADAARLERAPRLSAFEWPRYPAGTQRVREPFTHAGHPAPTLPAQQAVLL
jgi:hypothetical protein